jgi:hypothetical protein
MLALFYVFLVVVSLYLFTRLCPCACTIGHSLWRVVSSRTRNTMEPSVPARPPSPTTEFSRDATRFSTLLDTERRLVTSGEFTHVDNVSVLNLTHPAHLAATYGDHYMTLFRFGLPDVLCEASEFRRERGVLPSLKYMLNHDDTITGILY